MDTEDIPITPEKDVAMVICELMSGERTVMGSLVSLNMARDTILSVPEMRETIKELSIKLKDSLNTAALYEYDMEHRNAPCEQALNYLWKDIILSRNPGYGDWEYPGQAYRHIMCEFRELQARVQKLTTALEKIRDEAHTASDATEMAKEGLG